MKPLSADYIVVGCGAMGMAFADVLLSETDATMVMVDRYHQPGGHWNLAYPFVRLHQPSAYYGVNSRALGRDAIDTSGWNEGLLELATKAEVCCYFDDVMRQQFLPSGRVRYFPMCEYDGDGGFHSLLSRDAYRVKARKTVDATAMRVVVPSMRPPEYTVSQGVSCQPPNELPFVRGQYQHYTIVGAGKTGIDACLFLLANTVPPERISWVMPRDSWFQNRARVQPGKRTSQAIRWEELALEALAAATSIEDAFHKLESAGTLLRLDGGVWPTMYRAATITEAELHQLRRISDIVRLGHVIRVEPNEVNFERGMVAASPATLYVDCSADGLERRPARPVFAGDTITLQPVRSNQQAFSAAFIAHVEACYHDAATKNELCTPIPHPDSAVDYFRNRLANYANGDRWAREPDLRSWLQGARLYGYTTTKAQGPTQDADAASFKRLERLKGLATGNLERLLADVDAGAPVTVR